MVNVGATNDLDLLAATSDIFVVGSLELAADLKETSFVQTSRNDAQGDLHNVAIVQESRY